jgi:mannose-6-phosphate isomerase-like protein (cupin superfamily)
MEKVNLTHKFSLFQDYWSPKIAGELNDSYVKLAKLKGEFVWHHHEVEDELFLVVKGKLLIKLRDRDIWLEEGEFVIVPKGVEHLPIAEEEAHVLFCLSQNLRCTQAMCGARKRSPSWNESELG